MNHFRGLTVSLMVGHTLFLILPRGTLFLHLILPLIIVFLHALTSFRTIQGYTWELTGERERDGQYLSSDSYIPAHI